MGAASDITDRKAAEAEREGTLQELADGERRRRQALDAARPGSFNMDGPTGVLSVDSRLREVFGIAETDPGLGGLMRAVHPVDRARISDAVAAATRTGDPDPAYAVDHRVVHADGSVRWVSVNGRATFTGEGWGRRLVSFDGTVADVTDRRHAEADLAFQRHQLELIFRESPAAMTLWRGDDLVFERVNPEYQDLFRGRPLLGLPLLDALPELRGTGGRGASTTTRWTSPTESSRDEPWNRARRSCGKPCRTGNCCSRANGPPERRPSSRGG